MLKSAVAPTVTTPKLDAMCAVGGLGGIFLLPMIGAGVGASLGGMIGEKINRPAFSSIVGAIAGLPLGFFAYKLLLKKCGMA